MFLDQKTQIPKGRAMVRIPAPQSSSHSQKAEEEEELLPSNRGGQPPIQQTLRPVSGINKVITVRTRHDLTQDEKRERNR
mmetsp:Transcript_8524/g.13135  ORF Transcript_8524/g.13135 Transcript_8524/m.13135 type:complete len:80 (+) Transcript_8524:970-1209(+)